MKLLKSKLYSKYGEAVYCLDKKNSKSIKFIVTLKEKELMECNLENVIKDNRLLTGINWYRF